MDTMFITPILMVFFLLAWNADTPFSLLTISSSFNCLQLWGVLLGPSFSSVACYCYLFIRQLHFPYALIQVSSCSPLSLAVIPFCFDASISCSYLGVAAPFTLNTTLKFCPYKGSVCCNALQDGAIQRQFQLMNISDPACASLIKSISCAVRPVHPLSF